MEKNTRITSIAEYVTDEHLGAEASEDDVEVYARISQLALSQEFPEARVSVRIGEGNLSVVCDCSEDCACEYQVRQFIDKSWPAWLREACSNG